jgi:hypothetical protein
MSNSESTTPSVPKPQGDKTARKEAERAQAALENNREHFDRPRRGSDANGGLGEDPQPAHHPDKGSA